MTAHRLNKKMKMGWISAVGCVSPPQAGVTHHQNSPQKEITNKNARKVDALRAGDLWTHRANASYN
jgi:hypothetical protein